MANLTRQNKGGEVSVRDLMMLGAMFLFVPLAISNRRAAYLLWGWTAVLSPVYYLYGFMQSFRFNLLFAVIALSLLAFKPVPNTPFKASPTFVLMLLLLLHSMLSIAFGYPDNPFNEILGTQFLKSMVFCLVMFWFIENRDHMHALLVVLALGLGFHGVVEGLKVIATMGGHSVSGIPTSMMSDNNHFGVAMVMVIPILYYLHQYSAKKLVKIGFLIGLILTVVSVLGTHSRGGVVALAIVGLWFFATSRNKGKALVVILASALAVYLIAPDSWFVRVESISDAGGDASFMGRVAAWKISTAIALENPLFGGGFHALQVQSIWEKFKYSEGLLGFVVTPEPDIRAKAAHSIYFEIMGDMGLLGLLLFGAIFANAIRLRYRIKSMVKESGEHLAWAVDMADALMLSLLAYLVGGAAVSLAYFEPPFVIVMLMELVRQQVKKEVSLKSIGVLP